MISVSAMTRAQQFGEGSFPVIVKSLGQRGSAPTQIRLKVDLTRMTLTTSEVAKLIKIFHVYLRKIHTYAEKPNLYLT